jgi:hypothetical protein
MLLRVGWLQVLYRTRVLRETIAHLSTHLASVPHDDIRVCALPAATQCCSGTVAAFCRHDLMVFVSVC